MDLPWKGETFVSISQENSNVNMNLWTQPNIDKAQLLKHRVLLLFYTELQKGRQAEITFLKYLAVS